MKYITPSLVAVFPLNRYSVRNSFLSPFFYFFLLRLAIVYNRALRETSTPSAQKDNSSLLPGLPLFWSDSTRSPLMEWERWLDLIAGAVMAKYSISIDELTKTPVVDHSRIKTLIGDMAEEAAEKKGRRLVIPSDRRTRQKDVQG